MWWLLTFPYTIWGWGKMRNQPWLLRFWPEKQDEKDDINWKVGYLEISKLKENGLIQGSSKEQVFRLNSNLIDINGDVMSR